MLQRTAENMDFVGADRLTEVAESTLPAVRTEALEGVHTIDAGPSVSTRVVDAVVYIWKSNREKLSRKKN